MSKTKLIETAKKYRAMAYAPYSNFKVGAAVEGATGKIYGGCNVENSSYGLTICAERVAIAKAVSEGEKEIKRIAVVTSSKETSVSCGACRQVIFEFGKDIEVYCCGVEGECDEYNIRELLPAYDNDEVFRKKLQELRTKKCKN